MATPHNMIKAFLSTDGNPDSSVPLRDANLHNGHIIPLGKEDFAGALVAIDNDLDQNVTVALQGMNHNEIAWHTAVAGALVAAGAQGTLDCNDEWSMVRITYQAAGVPTSGQLYCGIQRRR